ncbi:hypothetical protein [Dysgonomonas sp. GY617]|nr:hypothetical protein [Dysgonomonas sp. GY617]
MSKRLKLGRKLLVRPHPYLSYTPASITSFTFKGIGDEIIPIIPFEILTP